jgi:ribonuclease BN (tRNA processing enzyme)
MTDEEGRVEISTELAAFLQGVNVLVADCQYTTSEYEHGGKAGFGHGTPAWIAKLANVVSPRQLGITHHEPNRSDADIERMLSECAAGVSQQKTELFICYDGLEISI